ncbi:MAG: hypothetical protein ACT4PT_08180 [Methanobacteriota archaeon]
MAQVAEEALFGIVYTRSRLEALRRALATILPHTDGRDRKVIHGLLCEIEELQEQNGADA